MTTYKYTYIQKRSFFGRQPRFCEVREHLIDSIDPDIKLQKQYILRNPVHQSVQVYSPKTECYMNTPKVETIPSGANHLEGGWPKDVDFQDEEHTSRYRRRVERDDAYVRAVLNCTPRLLPIIKQNNAIEMYQQFFKGMPLSSVEKNTIQIKCVCKDFKKRQVSCIDWTCEFNSKLVVTYGKRFFNISTIGLDRVERSGSIWDIEIPTRPIHVFVPPVECWHFACALENPTTIVGGLVSGTVCIFDILASKRPVLESVPYFSHREAITTVSFMSARNRNEFFTGSLDGRCMWWDMRQLNQPMTELIVSFRAPPSEEISMGNAEGVTALAFDKAFPAKLLCGTDSGFLISINRKGKTQSEIMSHVMLAHNGIVKSAVRNPFSPKTIITCGDYTSHIWNEDTESSPIVVGQKHQYPINDVIWAPNRCPSYMTVCSDGVLRYWDLLRNYFQPTIKLSISKNPLILLKPNEEGSIVAVGDIKGNISCLALSEGLTYSTDIEKQLMNQIFERENKRERIVDTRLKEIAIKLRDMMLTPKDEIEVNEEDNVKEVEAEYIQSTKNIMKEICPQGVYPNVTSAAEKKLVAAKKNKK